MEIFLMFKKAFMYLILFGCLLWAGNDLYGNYTTITPPQSQPSRSIVTKKAQSLPSQHNNPNTSGSSTPASNQQTTPANTTDPTSGYKWPKNTIQCNITTSNPKLILAYKDAINAWNQTGAFHFVLTDNPKAPITLGEQNLSNTKSDNGVETSQELGVTNVSYYPNQHLLGKADVKLDNDPMLLNNNRQYISWVAEHELGHAIGLAHTAQNADSVMVPVNPTHGITNNDIITVKQLYKE